MSRPGLVIRLKKGAGKPVRRGCPWVFAGDLVESSEHLLAEPGALAELQDKKGNVMGLGYFNAKSALAFRMLAPAPQVIDETFFEAKLRAALRLREQHFDAPYYRLVHAEGDGLPGLIIDRFGDICVLQVATAGMERLLPDVLAALDALIAPRALVLRNDFAARDLEGLPREMRVLRGNVPPRVEVLENGCAYAADLLHGQKTGWFYDQRDNRLLVAQAAVDRTVLDLYCHSGGFGLLAAKSSARRVTMVDSSALALELAAEAVKQNNLGEMCTIKRGDARDTMADLAAAKAHDGMVVVDPPAFVKRKQDIGPGLAAYAGLARQAAALVEDGGAAAMASCSHHAARPRFREAVLTGVKAAGKSGG